MGNSTNPIEAVGLQSVIVHRCGINKSTVSQIFTGKRRATPKQAAAIEEVFTRRGIPLNRWDLLYGVDVENQQSLAEYLNTKKEGDKTWGAI